jgi:hypothetical protein
VWWLKPVIPATQDAEIRRIEVQGQPGQKVHETPSKPMAGRLGNSGVHHPSYAGKRK